MYMNNGLYLQIKEKVTDLNTAWEALLKTFEQYHELCEQNLEAQVKTCHVLYLFIYSLLNGQFESPSFKLDSQDWVSQHCLDRSVVFGWRGWPLNFVSLR